MTLIELVTAVQALSGLSEEERVKSAVRLAAKEVWNTTDIPGTAQEIRIRADEQMFATLPYNVYQIRGVRNPVDKQQRELNTIHPQYHDSSWFQSYWTWRLIRRVPLQRAITNASTLVFRLKRTQTVPVNIIITGQVDYASKVVEPVTIAAGARQVETVERFVDIPMAIVKDHPTVSDMEILDADGRVLGVFPNHLRESQYQLVQFHDRNTVRHTYDGVFDVLFKPHMPNLEEHGDVFPAPFDQTVVYKALEQLKLGSESELATGIADAYNTKAAQVQGQFERDALQGKTLRPNYKRNPFVSSPGVRI